jgi:hypothetical protein
VGFVTGIFFHNAKVAAKEVLGESPQLQPLVFLLLVTCLYNIRELRMPALSNIN